MIIIRKSIFPAILFLFTLSLFSSCGKSVDSGSDNGAIDKSLISVAAQVDTLIPSAFLTTMNGILGADAGGVLAVGVLNKNKSTAHFTVTATFDGYTSEATREFSLGSSYSTIVYLTPPLTTEGFALLTESRTANCTVSVKVENNGAAEEIFRKSCQARLLPRNVMLWNYMGEDFDPFVVLWVTPNAPEVKELAVKAAAHHPGKTLPGYQGSETKDGYTRRQTQVSDTVLIPAGQTVAGQAMAFDTEYMSNIAISGSFSVSGGDSGAVTARLVSDTGDEIYNSGPKSGDTFSLGISKTGSYSLLFENTGTPRSERRVNFDVIPTYIEDLITPQVKAIYEALQQDYRMKNDPSAITFPDGAAQVIRLPGESLTSRTMNSLDGTVLFASALESIGMDPIIMLIPGHAFVGWKRWTGSSELDFLETTLIESASFREAHEKGKEEYDQYSDSSGRVIIDVKYVQNHGYIPLARQAAKKLLIPDVNQSR